MSKTVVDNGVDKELAEESPRAERQAPGLLRGFTGALSALARSLARAETPLAASAAAAGTAGDPGVTDAAENVEPARTESSTDSNVAPMTRGDFITNTNLKDGTGAEPLMNVRSALLSLLTELDGDEPVRTTAAESEVATAWSASSSTTAWSTSGGECESFAILSGKTIGVIGFSEARGIQLGQALAAQRSSFVTFSHADAEFRKGATAGCDVLLIEARPEWTELGSGEVSSLLTSKKPLVLLGERRSLMTAAVIAQGGPREFVASPCGIEEMIWHTAILLSRIPGPRVRGRKKNKVAQIIIGDDDPSSRTLVHAILAQEGMKCHAADNGAQALALARTKAADVVVVDVNMPGLDGFQVLAEIKRDPALAGVHVILLTTRQGEADVLRGFGLGADDYVTKPFSPLELAARVKRLLARPA